MLEIKLSEHESLSKYKIRGKVEAFTITENNKLLASAIFTLARKYAHILDINILETIVGLNPYDVLIRAISNYAEGKNINMVCCKNKSLYNHLFSLGFEKKGFKIVADTQKLLAHQCGSLN